MSLLQYTSDEMFSATDLVRKNKSIFDKLQKKEIEKAIILRDGKPSIMMLDFSEYEKLMKDYLNLKAGNSTNINTKTINETVVEEKTIKSDSKISQEDYEAAMKEIEKISFSSDFSIKEDDEQKTPQALKEFWEK
ncbi:hypothetical protein [Aliarcobacter cryaerophilus]|jgi:flagella basal body P-ring formation protein FlgA|uniref:Antitoxin n=3 Tax=unclassified Arcobacter TaxID=2593671 RepID=A0AA96DNN1_9BACT|nr:hypothetical protein [Aliarcobacter cryaerophilus]OQA76129.1 MAG: hypothetical protein BWY33_00339 [Candidatus Dependentiae bacterium ADurb.Bin246]WNL26959.1 hypothetical protein RMQ65_06550 [Arcobacter sp. AZ-2023]WPD05889.1 hypothetical protein QUR76_01545 [Arcobacter sp. DSM 115956]WPD07981.1 hypothetical protein QUR78_01545 [Arcobacter sp. DSM 115955]MCT7444477.1 hypothetical protein [Aliarcobacter cryaerophilus]